MIDGLITEQEEKIYTDFDQVYDYKLQNNRWYAKRKTSTTGKWYDITDRPVAVQRLNSRYGTNVQAATPTPATKPVPPTKPVVKPTPVNPVLPQIQKSGSMSSEYANKIDYTKLDPTKDTMRICKPGTEDCSQFVNDYSTKIKYVGNAWLAYRTDAVGKKIWSVFDKLDNADIQSYFNIYKGIKAGKGDTLVPTIKSLEQKLISKSGKPSNLQVDDVVGLFYPPSTHHVEAFLGSGEQGKGFYPNGMPGVTLKSGIGHTFNTHVGIVGAIKNGVPLIFHNIKGNVVSTPLSLANVVWVKRPV